MKWKMVMPILASSLLCATATFGDYGAADVGPNCDPCADCVISDWVLHVDYLYWNVRGCHLEYAIPSNGGSQAVGRLARVMPEYDHGFRAGLHKICDNSCLDIHYTGYSIKEHDEFHSSVNEIAGLLIIGDFAQNVQGAINLAFADWELTYDMIEVAKCYFWNPTDCASVGLVHSIKYASVNQSFHVLYSETSDVYGATNDLDLVDEILELKALGGGVGFVGKYAFCNCLEFHAGIHVDLMVADIEKRLHYVTSTDGLSSFTSAAELRDDCYQALTIITSSFGIEYAVCCEDGGSDFTLFLGYESQHWLNASGFLIPQIEAGDDVYIDHYQHNLAFDGFVGRLAYTF